MSGDMTVGRLMESIEDLPADTPIRLASGRGDSPTQFTLGEPALVEDEHGEPVLLIPEHDPAGRVTGLQATILNWRSQDRNGADS